MAGFYAPMKNSNGEKMPKKALITILGTSGDLTKNKADYKINGKNTKFYNTLALLIQEYSPEYEIIVFYTDTAKKKNAEILNHHKQNDPQFSSFDIDGLFKKGVYIKDENDFSQIFSQINQTISNEAYNKIIIDITHGFRHLPVLATIDMVIQNFSNPNKIEKILFAKEVEKLTQYEIINLKEYLDLANISFIMTSFNDNYTITNHINAGKKYENLLRALKTFSNNIMALNINSLLPDSTQNLINELQKLTDINDIAIKSQADKLQAYLKKLLNVYKNKEMFETYYFLAKDLIGKNYMLLGLILLYEGVRDYVVYKMFEAKNDLMSKVEEYYELDYYDRNRPYDEYAIREFCMGLRFKEKNKEYKNILNKNQNFLKNQYKELYTAFYEIEKINQIKKFFKNIDEIRNSLSHANSDESIINSQDKIKGFLNDFKQLILNQN